MLIQQFNCNLLGLEDPGGIELLRKLKNLSREEIS